MTPLGRKHTDCKTTSDRLVSQSEPKPFGSICLFVTAPHYLPSTTPTDGCSVVLQYTTFRTRLHIPTLPPTLSLVFGRRTVVRVCRYALRIRMERLHAVSGRHHRTGPVSRYRLPPW